MPKVDYSSVTPATGTDPCDKKITSTYANQMPASDQPARTGPRTDPDKTIPGPEAATGVNEAEEAKVKAETGEK